MGLVQPAEEMASGARSSSPCYLLQGRLSRKQNHASRSSIPWEDKGQHLPRRGSEREQGEPSAARRGGSGTGCTGRLRCLCPWTFSRPHWMKPWVMRSDLVADPALSTRLEWRPPEGPSNLNYPSDS